MESISVYLLLDEAINNNWDGIFISIHLAWQINNIIMLINLKVMHYFKQIWYHSASGRVRISVILAVKTIHESHSLKDSEGMSNLILQRRAENVVAGI